MQISHLHQSQNSSLNKSAKIKLIPKPKHLRYVFLIVFIVLLVAQLGALELPERVVSRSSNTSDHIAPLISVDLTQNDLLPKTIQHEWTDQTKENRQAVKRNHDLAAPILQNNFTTISTQPADGQQLMSFAGDLLVQSTANDGLISHAAHSNESARANALFVQDNPLEGLGSSLAELTAAGTAAGLMVHDLLSQSANLSPNDIASSIPLSETENQYLPMLHGVGGYLETLNPAASQLESGDENLDEDENGSAGRIRAYSSHPQHGDIPLARGAESDDQDDSSQSAKVEREDRPDSDALWAQRQRGLTSAGLAATNPTGPEANGPEPPSEEQMPDSMDSLIKSEGENVDTNGDEPDSETGQQQASTGINVVNDNEPALYHSQSIQPSREPADQAQSKPEYPEYDDDGELVPNSPGATNKMSYHSPISNLGQSNPMLSVPGGDLENNLVAPMRDSLSDLNTAAGHYYGKKKKKVKKIVIKKKKKKKKYVKKKKVKVIKVMKKKKKKWPKKKHHHHDHGKYYMYAKVPKKKAWEFGFKKGNKKHWIERHEKGYKNKFKTKVKWYDKKSKGKGLHIWDYNHHDKKKKHYG